MGTNECSQPASKSSWDSQDFGDITMGLKWPIFASPPGHDDLSALDNENTQLEVFKCHDNVGLFIQFWHFPNYLF